MATGYQLDEFERELKLLDTSKVGEKIDSNLASLLQTEVNKEKKDKEDKEEKTVFNYRFLSRVVSETPSTSDSEDSIFIF